MFYAVIKRNRDVRAVRLANVRCVKYITLSDGDFRARRAYFTKVARGRSARRGRGRRAPGSRRAQRRIQDAGIELAGVTKRFLTPAGTAFTALRDVDLSVEPGQFCAVVGPTGCGKSTTLTLVAGLDRPSAGAVRVGGQPVDGITQRHQLHVPGRCAAAVEDGAGQRGHGADLPRRGQEGRPGQRPGLAPRGRPGRLRGPSPASALRRHAQAGQPGRRADQRAVDPADGRAVRRPGRADQGDHVERAAPAVGPDPAVGHLRHPRPGGSHRPGRPGGRS